MLAAGRAKDVENSFPMKLQETELRTPDFPISIILPSLGSLSALKLNEWSDLSNQHGYASKTRLLVDPKCLSFSYLGWFHKWWYPVPPIAGWFILENPTKMDDNWGTPYFRKPPFNQLAIFRACKFEPFPVLVGATSIVVGYNYKFKPILHGLIQVYKLCHNYQQTTKELGHDYTLFIFLAVVSKEKWLVSTKLRSESATSWF